MSDLDELRERLTGGLPHLRSWHEASYQAGVDAVLALLEPVETLRFMPDVPLYRIKDQP